MTLQEVKEIRQRMAKRVKSKEPNLTEQEVEMITSILMQGIKEEMKCE